MYPNNPLSGFNPYYSNPFIQNPASMVPNYPVVQQTSPHMEINCVNGKESAHAFAMGPNSSAVLVDNLEPKIWLVTTDSSGYKAVNGFRIIPDNEETPIEADGKVEEEKEDPIKILTERIDKLEERMSNYGQSNAKSSWQNKSSNGHVQSNDRNGQGIKGSDGGNQSDGHQ